MIIDFCEKYNMLPREGVILCAVSGGKDSMCLLECLIEHAKDVGCEVRCAHFDHMLRGEASDGDRKFVENYCKERGIICYSERGDVNAFARKNGLGTEEAARRLRYAFLEKTADSIGATRIATAHTADDNLETMLLNLTRGSGLRGLCGIPPVRGRIIRPLLETTTSQVLEYLEEKNIPHVEDESNKSDDYSRNRVRHRVLPVLWEINHSLQTNSARTSAILREDEEYLAELAREFVEKYYDGESFPASEFSLLPRPVSARVLMLLTEGELSLPHIEAIRAIAEGNSPHSATDIPGIRVKREYDRLFFTQEERRAIITRTLNVPGVTELPEAGIRILCEEHTNCREIHNSFNTFYFKLDNICDIITIMSRPKGERVRLLGRKCTKTLKKLFSEARLNGADRDLIPVLCDRAGVVAVYGFGIAERCAASPGDDVLKVVVESTNQENESYFGKHM